MTHPRRSAEPITQLADARRSRQAPRIVDDSPAMAKVKKGVRIAVGDDGLAVLLAGPTGCGKSTFARSIHDLSVRSAGPFVELNCAAFPDTLLESELFGVAAGGHSTAEHPRAGLIEAADGGTLFLDEVAELSSSAQAKLLIVLEKKTFRRVGSATLQSADFRLITASHADLPALVDRGLFRKDLYYRIVGYEIRVPGLEERPDDILAIARDHLETVARSRSERAMNLRPAAEEFLIRQPWPGNIRDLQRAIRCAVACARDDGDHAIEPHHFEAYQPDRAPTLEEATIEYRRGFIARALERNRGNGARAAVELGVSRSGLYALIKRYGLSTTSGNDGAA